MSKKRGNGEGNMRKRPDGLWEQTIMIGYSADGKRKRKSFYGRTQREVKAKVEEFRQRQALGLTTDPDISFADWADIWYEGHQSQVSMVTYESYRYTLIALKEGFGTRKLRSIKPLDVEAFLKAKLKEKSESMVKKYRTMLYQIFHKAEANDLIIKNPVRFADKLKRKKAESTKDAFTREEIAILFRQLPDTRLGHTIRLMIGTGLRLQEVVCLEQEHIAPDGSMIHVRQAAESIKWRTVLNPGHTKSQLSKRDIPVPEFVRPSLLFLRVNSNPYAWDGREPGSVYNLRTFRAKYTMMMEKIEGVRPLTPHCCRHTYVTLLQSLNVPLEMIAGLTGHADIETTREYLHIRSEAAAQVSERYSRELAGLFQ